MSTIYLPLEASSPFPSTPGFLTPSPSPDVHIRKVIKSILKAKRIAVVCGAGISVEAGIPDFRSPDGLFQTLKKDNPTLSSGKDLFDASVFSSEATTSLFCQMIAQLSELSESASPTVFHKLLRALDDRGRLLRVYTQNIDALESKIGLTFGVPELDGAKRVKAKSSKGKDKSVESSVDGSTSPEAHQAALPPQTQNPNIASTSTGRLPSPPAETPRCIPLHGTLQSMHCQVCQHSFPLSEYVDSLSSGSPPRCPECTALEETRQLVGKRSRGVGKLRPSVVLYNEMHKDGEEVGEVVRRDLVGLGSKGKGKVKGGADLLLVVGTSLRVPGTKRIVREFSKAVKSRPIPSSSSGSSNPNTNTNPTPSSSSVRTGSLGESSTSRPSPRTGLATPTPSPRRTPSIDDEPPIRVVYLNFDFPVPTREWEGVFDVWVRGDAQSFAVMVQEEMEREERAKEEASERKRVREVERERRKLEEERKRVEEERKALESAKGKGKRKGKLKVKAKVQTTTKIKGKQKAEENVATKGKGKAKGQRSTKNVIIPKTEVNAKKRKAAEDHLPTSAKRHKTQITLTSTFKCSKHENTSAKAKQPKSVSKRSKDVRLTIKIPPRPGPRYSYVTPPSSQGRHWVPEVVIKTGSNLNPSTHPSTHPMPPPPSLGVSSPISPISPVSPMSSSMSPVSPMTPMTPVSPIGLISPSSPLSPLTSLLSSPSLTRRTSSSSGYLESPAIPDRDGDTRAGLGVGCAERERERQEAEWFQGSELSELDLDGEGDEEVDVVGGVEDMLVSRYGPRPAMDLASAAG